MAGISGVGGGSLSAQQIDAQRSAQVAKLQKEAVQQEGEQTLQLLQSAQVTGTGQNLNIQV